MVSLAGDKGYLSVEDLSAAIACDQPADNKYLAVWAKHTDTVGPWLEDPLYMYACSRELCPSHSPTPAPTLTQKPSLLPFPTASIFAPAPAPYSADNETNSR